MANDFCHIELTTDDAGKAKEFYGKLFSWTFQDIPMEGSTYTLIQPGAGPPGGLMNKPSPEIPTAWTAYVQVESVETYTAKVTELGGKVLMPRTLVPEYGHFAIIQDPTGGVLGLWEPLQKK